VKIKPINISISNRKVRIVVNIWMGHELDGWNSIPGSGQENFLFSAVSRSPLGHTQNSVFNGYRGLFP
jgi:hypothetical protein